jgi:hypothetical protein
MSFQKGVLQDIPTGVVMLFATAIIGKASQKMVEGYFNKSTDTPVDRITNDVLTEDKGETENEIK